MPSFTEAFLSQQNYYFLMKQANIPPSFHISHEKSLFQTRLVRVQNNRVDTCTDGKIKHFDGETPQHIKKTSYFCSATLFLRCNLGWTHSALDAFTPPLFHISALASLDASILQRIYRSTHLQSN